MAPLVPSAGPDRPSGNVAPDVDLRGVTEIRVHGVGGTTPQDLLGDPSPQLVAGDRIAGFYRTADRGGRHVEGYSWSGLTSRSSWRVLWLLLLPFMLANLAGWMALPQPGAGRDDAPTTAAFRWAARLAALAVTADVIIMIMMLSLDVVAYQCGGQPACATSAWWLSPLTWDGLPEHAGRRLVLGALTPLLLVAVFAALSYTSRQRYEDVAPPGRAGAVPAAPAASAAALPGGLRHGDFWAGATSHARLSRLHLAAALACVALVLCHCASATAEAWATGPAARSVWWLTWVLGVGVLVAVVALLAVESAPRRTSAAVLVAAGAASALAIGFAWAQPPTEDLLAQLPGMRWAANAALGAILLVGLAPLLLVVAVQPRARAVWRRVRGREPVGHRGAFRWGAPFVVVTLAIVLLDVVLLGVLVAVAQLLGSIVWAPVDAGAVVDPDATSVVIHVFPVVQVSTTWLTLGTLAILVAFAVVQLVRYLRAGRGRRALDALAGDYRSEPVTGATRTPLAWRTSALTPVGPQGKQNPWIGTVARWRFLAHSTTSLSYLLTSIVVAAVVAVATFEIGVWGLRDRISPAATALGVTIATAIPPALVLLMRRAWTQVDRRRLIGILWEVGTFWPRSFHPFAPPCYSERAVPDLLRRIWWLHDNGGRVLLASHSQGTVLAAAAVLRRSPRNDDGAEPEVVLVTFGSPLRKLYTWGFPAYLGDDVLAGLGRGEGGLGPVCWRNYAYPTDLIGGPVLPGTAGVDLRLSDPASSDYVYGQPPPPVGGHSGYWTDPRMWRDVDALAQRLTGTTASAPGVPVQRT